MSIVVGRPTTPVLIISRSVVGCNGSDSRPSDYDVAFNFAALGEVVPRLYARSELDVRAKIDAVSRPLNTMIASPTLKAEYACLLKAILDWFERGSSSGMVVLPVMVTSADQVTAVDVHLRLGSIELGGTMTTTRRFVLDQQLSATDVVLDDRLADTGSSLVLTCPSFQPADG